MTCRNNFIHTIEMDLQTQKTWRMLEIIAINFPCSSYIIILYYHYVEVTLHEYYSCASERVFLTSGIAVIHPLYCSKSQYYD